MPMSIGKAIGGALKWSTWGVPAAAARKGVPAMMRSRGGMIALGVGAAAAGGLSALNEGAYPEIYENVLGTRDPFKDTMRAAIATAHQEPARGVEDYYYGRPVDFGFSAPGNEARYRGRMEAVPGDVVFGLYNLRR